MMIANIGFQFSDGDRYLSTTQRPSESDSVSKLGEFATTQAVKVERAGLRIQLDFPLL